MKITIETVTGPEGGTAYKWQWEEHGFFDGAVMSGHGLSPNAIEACRDVGNSVYQYYGYAEQAGRLAIVGRVVHGVDL
jgi:hypothetical protein